MQMMAKKFVSSTLALLLKHHLGNRRVIQPLQSQQSTTSTCVRYGFNIKTYYIQTVIDLLSDDCNFLT